MYEKERKKDNKSISIHTSRAAQTYYANSHPISHRFPVTAQYSSNYRL